MKIPVIDIASIVLFELNFLPQNILRAPIAASCISLTCIWAWLYSILDDAVKHAFSRGANCILATPPFCRVRYVRCSNRSLSDWGCDYPISYLNCGRVYPCNFLKRFLKLAREENSPEFLGKVPRTRLQLGGGAHSLMTFSHTSKMRNGKFPEISLNVGDIPGVVSSQGVKTCGSWLFPMELLGDCSSESFSEFK